MKTNFIIILILLPVLCYGQIKTVKTGKKTIPKKTIPKKTSYDGSINYLGQDVHLYLGETLYYKCDKFKEESYYKGVIDFTTTIEKKQKPYISKKIYHPLNEFKTDYSKIVNSYFKVLEVIPHPNSNKKDPSNIYNDNYYLKLYNETLKDTVYYEYRINDFDFGFPFIVVKHFEYLKKDNIGKFYTTIGLKRGYFDSRKFPGGGDTKVYTNSRWKVIDVAIDEDECELSFIMERKRIKIIVSQITLELCLKKIESD